MLRNYYINKEWIVSPTARQVYRMGAVFSLALFGIIIAVSLERLPSSPFLLQGLKTLFFLGVLGTGITTVGMEYFLFGFDDSSALKKTVWFCVMLFIPVGPALYCFFVYSRSKLVVPTNSA